MPCVRPVHAPCACAPVRAPRAWTPVRALTAPHALCRVSPAQCLPVVWSLSAQVTVPAFPSFASPLAGFVTWHSASPQASESVSVRRVTSVPRYRAA